MPASRGSSRPRPLAPHCQTLPMPPAKKREALRPSISARTNIEISILWPPGWHVCARNRSWRGPEAPAMQAAGRRAPLARSLRGRSTPRALRRATRTTAAMTQGEGTLQTATFALGTRTSGTRARAGSLQTLAACACAEAGDCLLCPPRARAVCLCCLRERRGGVRCGAGWLGVLAATSRCADLCSLLPRVGRDSQGDSGTLRQLGTSCLAWLRPRWGTLAARRPRRRTRRCARATATPRP